ncbi:LacI family DNA-binding transcriptional regulator [Bacillus sp. 28A-2]|uniref:LacI family DNA-binding transcriptional regulator n=1 Tax=Bacillus sp. 28A-2 TaxID=2772252 RepID=UPI00168D075A|nr:LacI family DNA-binding transcriptional regulator [Bacillus sp. 28A-2]MBD3861614.1 LacI family DNA-binding transcriptional regulator [Bacillus sp. 28A-2]
MKKKITIRDVAEYAGVSRTTVSYVLNNVNKISEKTRKKVLKAMKDLDYQPDFTAISLSKRKSHIIGVVIPSYEQSIAPIFKENFYYTEMLAGMEYEFKKHDYDIIFSAIKHPQDLKNWIRRRNLDGLIFLGMVPQILQKELPLLDLPMVLTDNYEQSLEQFHKIFIDDLEGGYLATKHLIELGHTQIGFVGHDLTNISIDMNRYRGFEKALDEADLQINHKFLFDGKGSTFETGFQIGLEILSLHSNMTGIFASSDILALGIMKAFETNKRKVPEDFSIIGFDDIVMSKYITPSLTTIKQDVFNKGSVSAQTLFKAIEGKLEDPVHITLPIELIIRNSTAPRT